MKASFQALKFELSLPFPVLKAAQSAMFMVIPFKIKIYFY